MVPGTSYAKELNGDIGIELAITVKEEASNVKVEVTKLAAQPADTGALSGTAYKYFNFAMRNLEDTNVDTADITFDVENTWLAENNIDVATVVLNRYVGTEWVALETELVEEGETITSFKASAPGFSYFAITAEEIVGDTTPDTTEGVSYWWWIIGIVLVVGIGVALFYAVKKPQA
jgi:PGF-pre-PGF domain-containing protein